MAESQLKLSWKNLTVRTSKSIISRSSKTILKNVSGHLESGQLMALMGTSGAGKTTLFNALMFQNLEGIELESGTRCINGVPMTPKAMTYYAGYMIQNDQFIGSLTVREHLTFLGYLRLGNEKSHLQRQEIVESLITKMGLQKCSDTVIGIRGRLKGISGGERRRLCFASEVISDPPILLLDEPTTGLDSWMAENVVSLLREMRDQGKAIMCVIHQPSSEVFRIFDSLMLLSEGRVAFAGSTHEADKFFTSLGYPCPLDFNPADHYIYKLSMTPGHENEYDERIESICDSYSSSELCRTLEKKIDDNMATVDAPSIDVKKLEPYRSNWFHQFRSCLWRSWKSIIKEPAIIKIRIIQNLFFAVVVGIIYFGQELKQDNIININGVLFWTIMNQTFTTYGTVLNVFSDEIPIIKREHATGLYRVDAYFLARQLADLPLFLLTPTIFMVIFYFMALPDNGAERFFMSTLIIIIVVQTGVALGYLATSCTPDKETSLAVGPVITTPLMVFGGIYGSNRTIPDYLEWMKYISPWYYGNEAMEVVQWQHVTNITCKDDSSANCFETGLDVLDFYSMNVDNLTFDIVMLFVLGLAMRTISCLALFYRARRRTS